LTSTKSIRKNCSRKIRILKEDEDVKVRCRKHLEKFLTIIIVTKNNENIPLSMYSDSFIAGWNKFA
jgi:hypothetical protein